MDAIVTDNPFSEEQERALIALAGATIPASAAYAVPGADDPLIAADIVATARRYADAVIAALDGADRAALAAHGAKFLDLDAAARKGLVEADRPGAAGAARTLLSIIAQCYYRDDRVMRSLEMEPRAPFPQGFEVEQGDWSLLEPVKQRGRVYREVPR